MTGKERVKRTILRQDRDRMPIYGWINNGEFLPKVLEKYGSPAAFYDKYEFDMYHLFPYAAPIKNMKPEYSSIFFEDELPELEFSDPAEMPYQHIKGEMDLYSAEKGRFVYAQTPGCFEFFNGVWGIQNNLSYLLLHTEQMREFYERLADWTIVFANNLIDRGVDMIHISDDWGAQNGLMFSNDLWYYLVYPYHKKVVKAVKERGVFVSLHSDGNVASVLDGICDIGFDVVHPYQESAGMGYDVYLNKYKNTSHKRVDH